MHFELDCQAIDVINAAEALYGEDGREWRWTLKGDNGETVASGDGFESEAACRHSIELVKSAGPDTEIRVVQS